MDYRNTLEILAKRSHAGDQVASAVLQRELEAPLERLQNRQARLEAEKRRRIDEIRRRGENVSANDPRVRFDESKWLVRRLIGELCRKAASQPRAARLPDPHAETIRVG